MSEKIEKNRQMTALFSSFFTENVWQKKKRKLIQWQLWCQFFSETIKCLRKWQLFYSWFFIETIRCTKKKILSKEILWNDSIIFAVFSLKWFDEKTRQLTTAAVFQSYFLPNDFDIYFWSKLRVDLNSNCKPNRQHGMNSNISKLLQTTHQWIGGLYFDYSLGDPWRKILKSSSRYVILYFSNSIASFLNLIQKWMIFKFLSKYYVLSPD